MSARHTSDKSLRVRQYNPVHPGQFEVSNDHVKKADWDREYVAFSGYFGLHGPHVFAEAPEVLAALQEAVEQYGKPGGPWNVPSDPGGWLKRARRAIAKATSQ